MFCRGKDNDIYHFIIYQLPFFCAFISLALYGQRKRTEFKQHYLCCLSASSIHSRLVKKISLRSAMKCCLTANNLQTKAWYMYFKPWSVHFKLWSVHFKLWSIDFKACHFSFSLFLLPFLSSHFSFLISLLPPFERGLGCVLSSLMISLTEPTIPSMIQVWNGATTKPITNPHVK